MEIVQCRCRSDTCPKVQSCTPCHPAAARLRDTPHQHHTVLLRDNRLCRNTHKHLQQRSFDRRRHNLCRNCRGRGRSILHSHRSTRLLLVEANSPMAQHIQKDTLHRHLDRSRRRSSRMPPRYTLSRKCTCCPRLQSPCTCRDRYRCDTWPSLRRKGSGRKVVRPSHHHKHKPVAAQATPHPSK